MNGDGKSEGARTPGDQIELRLTAQEADVLRQMVETYELRGTAASLTGLLPIFRSIHQKLRLAQMSGRALPVVEAEAQSEVPAMENPDRAGEA